ncbi:ribosomal protein L1-like protein [Cercophora newfieldiana]|uniref:Ribosomal protein L1-like protein n=1 Tax=Cercophora newfieldiana TaxID=92897 RepID=A0AA39YGT5_9PEZI|nr:ribosomal protein L1-like protein [Cercophora newfieldiana]
MASTNQCVASMARLNLSYSTRRPAISTIPNFLLPSVATPQIRHASGSGGGGMRKRPEKPKKQYKLFRSYDQSEQQKFSLCDAMRYLRAFEVGKPPSGAKYEVHVKLRTEKAGPVVRNRIRFPYPVSSDTRIAVICPEDSPVAAEALQLGAVVAGQESLFESIKNGHFAFNKLICHTESEDALKKANVGKLLGPKGLMPNKRHGTITSDLKKTINDMVGTDEYRERNGVVQLAIGQLGFTPQMVADNLKVVMERMKKDMDAIVDNGHTKHLDEVVLSSTHGPSFSLNGKFNPTEDNVTVEQLQSTM